MSRLDVGRMRRERGMVSEEEFFLEIVSQLSQQSNSDERRQGALLVKNRSIIASASFDAYETKKEGKVVGSGAIESLLAVCAGNGVCTAGATLYVFSFPNDIVCKLLEKAAIKEIVFVKVTDSLLGKELCSKAGIKVTLFERK